MSASFSNDQLLAAGSPRSFPLFFLFAAPAKNHRTPMMTTISAMKGTTINVFFHEEKNHASGSHQKLDINPGGFKTSGVYLKQFH
jgi:hypothetical protein